MVERSAGRKASIPMSVVGSNPAGTKKSILIIWYCICSSVVERGGDHLLDCPGRWFESNQIQLINNLVINNIKFGPIAQW